MNWLTFTIAAYLCLAGQAGLRPLLALPATGSGVYPSFMLVLLVFVGMQARGSAAAVAGLILGGLVDLLPGPGGMIVVGPTALAYLVGVYATRQLRALVYPRSVFALGALVVPVGVLVTLVRVTLYSFGQAGLFSAEPIAGWSVWGELGVGLLQVLYTAVFALILGTILLRGIKWWRFPTHHNEPSS